MRGAPDREFEFVDPPPDPADSARIVERLLASSTAAATQQRLREDLATATATVAALETSAAASPAEPIPRILHPEASAAEFMRAIEQARAGSPLQVVLASLDCHSIIAALTEAAKRHADVQVLFNEKSATRDADGRAALLSLRANGGNVRFIRDHPERPPVQTNVLVSRTCLLYAPMPLNAVVAKDTFQKGLMVSEPTEAAYTSAISEYADACLKSYPWEEGSGSSYSRAPKCIGGS